jgi:site-specific DNA-methyltransferase (adenine-specific)
LLELNRIYNMDCLEGMRQIEDKSVKLTFTSPPYNMRTRIRNGQYTIRETSEHFSKKYSVFGDDLSIDDYYHFHKQALIEMMRISKIVFWNIQIVTGSKEAIFKIIGDYNKNLKDIIVWDKGWGQPSMHESVINRGVELILIFESDAMAGRAFRECNFSRGEMEDIWRINRGENIEGNAACFPVGLPSKAITGWSKEGDVVLDPFMGSGTTAIAAIKLGRKFIGFEKEKVYFDAAEKRIKKAQEQGKISEWF